MRIGLSAERARQRSMAWKIANPERTRRNNQSNHLKRTYGITMEEYSELADRQGHRCAICSRHSNDLVRTDSRGVRVDRLYVDHLDNQIRGLLCKNCNIAIGLLQEEPSVLEMALEYVRCG